jgi:hypothetical protein
MKQSKWIWCAQHGACEYNQTVLFQQEFTVKETDGALLQIPSAANISR